MDGLADGFVDHRRALAVRVVIRGALRPDAEPSGFLGSVDVGSQEQEFPAVFLLLTANHGLNPVVAVAAAGVFQAVGGDDEEGLLRPVFLSGVLVDVSDVVDGPAYRVQQRGAAPDKVFLFRQGLDFLQRHPVVDHLNFVVEKHRGDQGLTRLPLLLFDHGVEAADGVLLQARHGAAAVENKYDFRQVLFHVAFLHNNNEAAGVLQPCGLIILCFFPAVVS